MATTNDGLDESAHPASADKRHRLARWLKGSGIEVGALHHPLAVPADARVTYVDRMTESELRRHYPELEAEAFAPVTVIGNAEDLSAFTDGSLDFVIANHLLEHLEDPIRALREFHRVLRRDGVLYLALPDARVTFDRDRELTSIDHLIGEYRSGTAPNRRAHYRDWALSVDKHRDPEAHAARLDAMDYSIHFHVWLPDSFLDFLVEARREAKLEFYKGGLVPVAITPSEVNVEVIRKDPALDAIARVGNQRARCHPVSSPGDARLAWDVVIDPDADPAPEPAAVHTARGSRGASLVVMKPTRRRTAETSQ